MKAAKCFFKLIFILFVSLKLFTIYQKKANKQYEIRPVYKNLYQKYVNYIKNDKAQKILRFLEANFQNYIGSLYIISFLSIFIKGLLPFATANLLVLQFLQTSLPNLKNLKDPQGFNDLTDLLMVAMVQIMSCLMDKCQSC